MLRKPGEDWRAPVLETDARAQRGSEENPECGLRLRSQKRACTAGDRSPEVSQLPSFPSGRMDAPWCSSVASFPQFVNVTHRYSDSRFQRVDSKATESLLTWHL